MPKQGGLVYFYPEQAVCEKTPVMREDYVNVRIPRKDANVLRKLYRVLYNGHDALVKLSPREGVKVYTVNQTLEK